MSDIAISVRDVSKCYRVFDDQRSRLLHAVWPSHIRGMQEIWALDQINFDIERGESVAIIGRNGGGKSTLLEILTGTLTPTSGEVKVNGRVSALLELGSGFNPEYSGRDNVILNGLLLGLSREEILGRFGEIEAFAEIGAAIDRPVKTYSSGMMMRLAFAVQVLCDPEILIIDEALSVGDFFFQQKCFKHIRSLKSKGLTLLFVSHDMGTVRDLCTRAIYLQSGKSVCIGETDEVLKLYYRHGVSSEPDNNLPAEMGAPASLQTGIVDTHDAVRGFIESAQWAVKDAVTPPASAKIVAVKVVNSKNQPTFTCKIGEKLRFRVMLMLDAHVPAHVSFGIKNKHDQLVTCMGTYQADGPEIKLDTAGYAVCDFEITFNLEAGGYSIHFSAGMPGTDGAPGINYDQTPSIGPINITWDYSTDKAPFTGMMGLPLSCSMATADTL